MRQDTDGHLQQQARATVAVRPARTTASCPGSCPSMILHAELLGSYEAQPVTNRTRRRVDGALRAHMGRSNADKWQARRRAARLRHETQHRHKILVRANWVHHPLHPPLTFTRYRTLSRNTYYAPCRRLIGGTSLGSFPANLKVLSGVYIP